jgi:hypothetical protein
MYIYKNKYDKTNEIQSVIIKDIIKSVTAPLMQTPPYPTGCRHFFFFFFFFLLLFRSLPHPLIDSEPHRLVIFVQEFVGPST